MSEKATVITYEKLFEFLRLEKSRDELQQLDPDFFEQVLQYLCSKKESFENKQSQQLLFERDEKEKARLELQNVRKILKDLYDRREKKIINMALNKSRSGISLVNMSAMLPSEQALFNAINLKLSEFREDILFRIVSGELPCKNYHCIPKEAAVGQVGSSSEEADGAVHAHFNQSEASQDSQALASEETKELKTSPFLNENTANLKRVRFLAPIDEVIGPDLQIYGPYDSGAVKELPSELAAVLVKNKQAEEV